MPSLPSRGPTRTEAPVSTILLVESDPLQASVCKSILERRFHDVQRVGDAAEALCLVEQRQFAGHLGLVISDLNMSGIGSPAFVAELHERLPKVPILVLGSGDEAANANAVNATNANEWLRFLPRPFASEEFLTAAGELLAQHAWQAA
jgi:DNA-binding NtrC family response regulator